MQLTFDEAMLFARAGDDVRLSSWPSGHFVRLVPAGTPAPAGFVGKPYYPTALERSLATWSRA